MKSSLLFHPRKLIHKYTNRWWLPALLMIIGGLLGLIFSYFSPPIYEGKAVFAVTIDYTRTGALSDIQEDQAMRDVGSLIDSTLVLQNTVQRANANGYSFTVEDFRAISMVEREEFRWSLRVRSKNPQQAAELTSMWAEEANGLLMDASKNALIADNLFRYLDSLETCLQRTAQLDSSVVPCTISNLPEILKEIEMTGEKAYQVKEASRGIMPALTAEMVEWGEIPKEPVNQSRNAKILIGVMIGFIISFGWLIISHQEFELEKLIDK